MPSGPGGLDAEGVWQYGEADTETLASDLLNLGQASVSTQFSDDRARLDVLEGVDEFIIPTSVAGTGVTLNSDGSVTVTTATSININGCFPSAYTVVDMIAEVTAHSVNSQLQFRFRVGGVDNSTASSYNNQTTQRFASTNTTANLAANLGNLTATTLGEDSLTTRFYSPRAARATRWSAEFVGLQTATLVVGDIKGRHNQATAYDGLTIIPSAGNITGTLWFIGMC